MPFDGPDVSSSFQKRPAYRYLRRSDHLPRYEQTFTSPGHDIPLSQIEAKVKLFNPTGIGTWYVAAYDPEDRIAWGLADLHEREIGSFSMQELVDFRGRFGLPIERDLHWSPKSLATLQAGGGRYRNRIPGVTTGNPGWSIPGVSGSLTGRSSRPRYARR